MVIPPLNVKGFTVFFEAFRQESKPRNPVAPKNKPEKNKKSGKSDQSKKKKKDKKERKPDFDSILTQGPACYDSDVGAWWNKLSLDGPHKRAYRNIARQIKKRYEETNTPFPRVIVDYACGNGSLIRELIRVFPESTIVGLDGSSQLISMFEEHPPGKVSFGKVPGSRAFAAEGPQIRLVKTGLPNFRLQKHQADLAILSFPNLVHDFENVELFNRNGYCNTIDAQVGQYLARFREMDPEDEISPPDPEDEILDELLTARVYSLNLRRLLRTGGTLVRVEYTNGFRHELTDLTQWRSTFAEGALDKPIKDTKSRQFFKLDHNLYFRSQVIHDVYEQTGDPSDLEGGYGIIWFEALDF